jgi:hypothetical protein
MRTYSIHRFFVFLILLGLLINSGYGPTNIIAASAATNIGSCQLFPDNNFWNVPIDDLPIHPNSAHWVNSIGANDTFHMDFGSGTWNGGPIGIPSNVVSGALVNEYVFDFDYPDESDPGPYPLPANPQMEWGSDHHILTVDTDDCTLYELYDASLNNGQWSGGSGAIWDLASNDLRPDTWTSADAAGFPILPGLAQYPEVSAGVIEHAMRFTANCTADYYIWPARHEAQYGTCATPVPFGARFRLKADYDISGFSAQAQVLLQAFKTYGIVLADNGSDWYISGSPSESWDNDQLHELDILAGSDFEAVDTSGLMIDYDSAGTGFVISGNAGVGSAIVSYLNGTLKTVTADGNGNYSFAVPPNWSGTATPSRAGLTFNPPSRSYSNVTYNMINENYTALVMITGNVGIAGATVNYTGDSTVADGSGNYTITVPWGWSGTVTPSLGGDAFCPGSKTYSHVTANLTSQNYAHTTCPQFDPMTQWTTDYSYNAQQWRVQYHPRLLGDVDGDGDDDIVGFGYDRVLVALSNGVNGFAPMTQWTTDYSYNLQQWRTEYHPRLLGDVNGDGKADIVGFGYDRVLVALSTGTSFAPMTQWTTDYSYNAQGWRVEKHPRLLGDVNNDGRDDIVGFGNDRVLVALSTGTSFAPMTQWTTDFSYNAQQWRTEYHPRLLGDVNNDSRDDIVGFGNDRVLVALSTGSGFAPMTQWTTDYSYNAQQWRVQYHPRLLADVNGDGTDDILGFGFDRVLVALSNGSGFASMVQATTDYSYNLQQWRVEFHPRLTGDFNGDGRDDLIGFGYDRVLVATAK